MEYKTVEEVNAGFLKRYELEYGQVNPGPAKSGALTGSGQSDQVNDKEEMAAVKLKNGLTLLGIVGGSMAVRWVVKKVGVLVFLQAISEVIAKKPVQARPTLSAQTQSPASPIPPASQPPAPELPVASQAPKPEAPATPVQPSPTTTNTQPTAAASARLKLQGKWLKILTRPFRALILGGARNGKTALAHFLLEALHCLGSIYLLAFPKDKMHLLPP